MEPLRYAPSHRPSVSQGLPVPLLHTWLPLLGPKQIGPKSGEAQRSKRWFISRKMEQEGREGRRGR